MSPPPRRRHEHMLDEAAHNLTRLVAQRVDRPPSSAPPARRLCHSCHLVASSQQVVTHDGRALLVCADCALPVRLSLSAANAAGPRSAALAAFEVPVAVPRALEAGPLLASSDDDAADRPAASGEALYPAALAALSLPRAAAAIATATQSVGAYASPAAPPAPPCVVTRRLDGAVPPGYKVCNLCGEMQAIAAFPTSGERIKPYCHSCMPSVRRGMQMGMKMQTLREIYGEGGLPAVQAATGAHSGPSHAYGAASHTTSVTTRARSASEAHRDPSQHSAAAVASDVPPHATAASPAPEMTAAARASVDLLLAAAGGTLALYDDALPPHQHGVDASEHARGAAEAGALRAEASSPGAHARSPATAALNFVHASRMDRHASMAQRSGALERAPGAGRLVSGGAHPLGGTRRALGSPDGQSRLPAAFRAIYDTDAQQQQQQQQQQRRPE